MNDDAPSFGDWVRERRTLAGIATQGELADRMSRHMTESVSTNYVWQIENGRTKIPQQPFLRALAKALSISEVEILRAAGLISEEPTEAEPSTQSVDDDPLMRVAFYGAKNLTPDGRKLMAEMLSDQIKRIEEFESGRRSPGKRRSVRGLDTNAR